MRECVVTWECQLPINARSCNHHAYYCVTAVQDDNQADYLARNDHPERNTNDDPLLHVLALRSHLYTGRIDDNGADLQLLERIKVVDMLSQFVIYYRKLIIYASTPIPFPMVQMGRTFLFLWTFSIPFVLRGVVEERFTAMVFVFFLTYGFIGMVRTVSKEARILYIVMYFFHPNILFFQ